MFFFSFFFNDTATTEIYPLSLHDALPIWSRFAVPSQCRAKEALARSAHQQRIAKLRELRKLLQQFVILREAFAEADARIEDDLRFRDASLSRDGHGPAQPLNDIFHDIPRKSSRLHRSRLSTHVHQDERHAMARGDLGNLRV